MLEKVTNFTKIVTICLTSKKLMKVTMFDAYNSFSCV